MRVRVSDDPDEMTGRMQVEADGELDERRMEEAAADYKALAEQLAAALSDCVRRARCHYEDSIPRGRDACPTCQAGGRALAAAKERGIG